MKTLFLSIQFLFVTLFISQTVFSQRHFDRVVGKMIEESPTITCNRDSLLNYFDEFVKSTVHIDVRFDNVSIEQGEDYFYLFVVDNDTKVKSAYELVLDQNNFYQIMTPEGGGSTVTCTGCAVGCNPKKLASGEWACWPTCSPATCTKSVTIVID